MLLFVADGRSVVQTGTFSASGDTVATLITIFVYVYDDGIVSDGTDVVAVTISGANSGTPTMTYAGHDGLYTGSYTPSATGTDHFAVTVNGNAMTGSPFDWLIQAAHTALRATRFFTAKSGIHGGRRRRR